MNFNEYLKHVRQDLLGMTQDRFVRTLASFDKETFGSVSVVTYSRWETGFSRPSNKRRERIFKALQHETKQSFPALKSDALIIRSLLNREIAKGLLQTNSLPVTAVASSSEIDKFIVLSPFSELPDQDIYSGLFHAIHQTRTLGEMHILPEDFIRLSQYPSTFFLTATYHSQVFGALFGVKLTLEASKRYLTGSLTPDMFTPEDIATNEDMGYFASILFFSYSKYVGEELLMRMYAHLIEHQDTILGVGAHLALEETRRFVTRLGLEADTNAKVVSDKLYFHHASLPHILSQPIVLDMVFLPTSKDKT